MSPVSLSPGTLGTVWIASSMDRVRLDEHSAIGSTSEVSTNGSTDGSTKDGTEGEGSGSGPGGDEESGPVKRSGNVRGYNYKRIKVRGRPPFVVTDQNKRSVYTMSLHGIGQTKIAATLGIDRDTLAKFFRDELDVTLELRRETVQGMAYRMAISGKCVAMTIFYLKTQCGWKESSTSVEGNIEHRHRHEHAHVFIDQFTSRIASIAARIREDEAPKVINGEGSGSVDEQLAVLGSPEAAATGR